MKGSRVTASIWCTFLLVALSPAVHAAPISVTIIQTAEIEGGYERSLFKHWIDEDRDGCDTRKEVLIAEAIIKPSVSKGCLLSGGAWLSAYDGKKITNSSDLDIDHVVPLAEAWRSGAWAWTPEQRTAFANDISDPRTLIAVTASTNRAKGDKDPAQWLPAINRCDYIQSWVGIKVRYALTFDANEVAVIKGYFDECRNLQIQSQVLPGYSVTLANAKTPYAEVELVVQAEASPAVTSAALKKIKLYDRCSTPGSRMRSVSGEVLLCKKTSKDSTLKWRLP